MRVTTADVDGWMTQSGYFPKHWQPVVRRAINGLPKATGLVPYPFNIGNLWTIGDCPNPPCTSVVSLTDLDSYLYVTAGNADGVVRANTNYVGWYQAWQLIH
jgi:hypothetical protein